MKGYNHSFPLAALLQNLPRCTTKPIICDSPAGPYFLFSANYTF